MHTGRTAVRVTRTEGLHALRSGGSVEADPGLVGQAGDPLGPQHRRLPKELEDKGPYA